MTTLTILADAAPTFPGWLPSALMAAAKIFILINVILGLVSYTVWAERKISAAIPDYISLTCVLPNAPDGITLNPP